ncbi:hypothetical protein PINS_up017452 [Pythium insidiosum]|nr:hypothetical protein PINS_up017452 [Pythium insidiosum]
MLLDADTLFFESPMTLWSSSAYQATGTLFFTDRISYDASYLAKRVPGRDHVSFLHDFMASFDVAPFRALASLPRAPPSPSPLARVLAVPVAVLVCAERRAAAEPPWTLRAGHQMDSSLVLWHKEWQPRATAILAAFSRGRRVPVRSGRRRAAGRRCVRRRKPAAARRAVLRRQGALLSRVRARRDAVRVHAARRVATSAPTCDWTPATGGCGAVWRRAALRSPTTIASDPRAALHQQRRHALVDVGRDATVSLVARPASLSRGPSRSRLPQTCPFNGVGAGADTSAGRSGATPPGAPCV